MTLCHQSRKIPQILLGAAIGILGTLLGLAATFVLSAIWRNHLVAREKLKSQRAEQEAVELMNQQKSVDSKR